MAIVRQLPCPGCGNWMDRGIARCLECGKILPPVTRKQLAHAQEVADGSLTALREEQRRKAESLTVSEETLAEWYEAQVARVDARIAQLVEAIDANHGRLNGPADPNWRRWYEQVARLGYVEETGWFLKMRKHVLVCPNHGIGGVEFNAWPLAHLLMPDPERDGGLARREYEALSLRGLLTGEGATAWERYCEHCSAPQLEQAAQRLMRAHTAPIPEVGEYSGKPMRPVASRRRAGGAKGGEVVSTLGQGKK